MKIIRITLIISSSRHFPKSNLKTLSKWEAAILKPTIPTQQ
jgi:hypothetical protein